jgi:hypothetical protein
MRRIVAGLLALTLLALPGLPMRHAVAAPGKAPAAHHCVTDEAAAPADHAADHGAMMHQPSAAPESGQPQDRDPSGMACCPAAQCPVTVAVPAVALPAPLPPAAASLATAPADHQFDGIPVDPALRPPRVA